MPPASYKKGTIAGDDWKAFEDKYRFKPCGETETALRDIWAASERDGDRRAESWQTSTPVSSAT